MTSRIYITEVGKQVATSGLLPETADALLTYISTRESQLSSLANVNALQNAKDRDKFDFCMIFACLSSPEFSGQKQTRFLHYGLDARVSNRFVTSCASLLSQSPWEPYRNSANAADLLLHWIQGVPMRDLENTFSGLRAGKIHAMAREASWCLAGFADILATATRQDLTPNERPRALRQASAESLDQLRSLIPIIRFLTWRLNTGFPAECLWMSELKDANGRALIIRPEAVALHHAGLCSYTDLRQRDNWKDVIECLKKARIKDAQKSAKKMQEGAHEWHKMARNKTHTKLAFQLPVFANDLQKFFDSREYAFQDAFEKLMNAANIKFTLFDDRTKPKPGAFDYLIHTEDRPDFIIECKTKQGDSLVEMNEARSVLAASSQFGCDNLFCVTLCNPGINPDVLAGFSEARRLAIVETQDMAVALTRVISGKLTAQGFHDWLTQPGLAKAENIYAYSSNADVGPAHVAHTDHITMTASR